MKNRKNPPVAPFGKGGGYLEQAVRLAAQVDPHKVRPNPRVGCVVVRNGKIISEGVHEVFGGAHAEVNAFANISPDFEKSGLEIYITLEPCDHFEGKKTPSCTELLISRKPKKIIIGYLDPKFGGKSVEKLRNAGIEVEVRNCEKCQALNPFFEKFVKTGLPYVTLKLAQSLDGKITRGNYPSPDFAKSGLDEMREREERGYISNELSRKKVHAMRAQYSAILTTTETVLVDNPRMDCRMGEFNVTPPHPLLNQEGGNPDVILVGKRKIPKTAKFFGIPNRKIHFFPTHDLEHVLRECGKLGIDSVLTECGATVATELLQKNLVDEIQLFIAPEVFGNGKSVFTDGVSMKNFRLTEVRDLEGDVWVKFERT